MLPKNYNEIINNTALLENYIKDQSKKYYTDGSNELEDDEFDLLVDRLRVLNPHSSVLSTGWGFEVVGNKVKHKYTHIGSLDKAKSYDEFNDIFKNKKVYISPKLDGLSAVCYYKNGELIKALTRGNGEYGKDITDKMKVIEGKTIQDSTFTGSVRGELILNEHNWQLIKSQSVEELIAPRNYVAGIINRDKLSLEVSLIDFVTYKKLADEQYNYPFIFREDMLLWLSRNFKHSVPIFYFECLSKNLWEQEHQNIFDRFKQLGWELDGLVLTLDNIPYSSDSKSFIFSEQAFKFKSESTSTIITDMEWTLSKNQRLVPVAIVKPIQLSGAIIQRVTCNNAKQVKDWGLGIGAEIEITRSNEIIPRILAVIQESDQPLPCVCPICNQPLSWSGVDLVCTNPVCYNIDLSDLEQWCTVIGETDGLQWTLMKEYLDKYHIDTVEMLYEYKDKVYNDLLNRNLSITESKILLFFNKLYKSHISLYNVLLALNIPRLGSVTAKLLADNPDVVFSIYRYSVGEHVSTFNIDSLKALLSPIVKTATTEEIISNIDKFMRIQYLYTDNECRIDVSINTNKEIQYVAVTGSLNTMKRKDFENYINKYGYELTTNLKKCIYLITNNPNSTSTKNKEADKYNVTKITEQEFLSKLNK